MYLDVNHDISPNQRYFPNKFRGNMLSSIDYDIHIVDLFSLILGNLGMTNSYYHLKRYLSFKNISEFPHLTDVTESEKTEREER